MYSEVALFYLAGFLATGIWLVASLGPGAQRLYAGNKAAARAGALAMVGIAVVWPLSAAVIAWTRRTASMEELSHLAELDRDEYQLPAPERQVALPAPDYSALPALMTCASCGASLDDAAAITFGNPDDPAADA